MRMLASSRELSPVMKLQVRTLQAPGWLLPLVFLAGLALIPVALFIALAVLGLALTGALFRALLPSAASSAASQPFPRPGRPSVPRQGVLDVEYEIKDDHEKK